MDSSLLKELGGIFNFHRLVLLAWVMTFIYLIWNDNFTLFLKPEFGFLIYAGLIICCLFLFSTFYENMGGNSISATLNGLIILLPVLFILLTGDQTLSSFALSKRTIMSPGAQLFQSGAAPDAAQDEKTAQKPDAQMETSSEISLSDLLMSWKIYSGKKVTLQGLFNQSLEDNENYALVFKYLISCCAADAIPVGIFVEKKNAIGFKDDDWVRVSGVVTLEKMNGNDVILMSLDSIEKAVKPSKIAAYMFL